MTHDANIIKAMDTICRALNDERLEELWLTFGVPDGADEDDYEAIADSPRMREDTEKEFFNIAATVCGSDMPICWEGSKKCR